MVNCQGKIAGRLILEKLLHALELVVIQEICLNSLHVYCYLTKVATAFALVVMSYTKARVYFPVVNYYSTRSIDFLLAIDNVIRHYNGSQGLLPSYLSFVISQCNNSPAILFQWYVLSKASGLFPCSKI